MNRFLTNRRLYDYLKIALIPLLTVFITMGCSSSGGDGSSTPAGNVDNSNFYGTYDMELRIGSCLDETSTIEVGNDNTRELEDDYVYIPQDTNSATFTLNGKQVTVTVEGNKVTVERSENTWVFDIEITFSDDRSTFTVTGEVSGDEDCNGEITATGTKVSTTSDFSGDWRLRVENIKSTDCPDEDPWTSDLTITQSGSDLTVVGSKMGEGYVVYGTVSGSTITISGNFREAGGITTSTFVLTEQPDGSLAGPETWTWTDGVDSCSGGTADATLTRQP